MVSLSRDVSQGESCSMSVPTAPAPFDRSQARITNTIRAELEEIAFAEADVVNLKQKAADLHLQLNHPHVHSSFCKSCGHDLRAQKHEMTQKLQQQIFVTANDVLLYEGTKKNEVKDVLLSCDSRAVKTQVIPSVQSRQPHRKQQYLTSTSMFNSDLVEEPLAKNEKQRD